jgi:hypothetical protein
MLLSGCRLCLLLAILIGCAGCNSLMGSLAYQVPSVHGRWRGRVTWVKVYDYHGRAYDAAALEVTDGPSIAELKLRPESGVGPTTEVSRPLLTRWDDWCRLIDPSSLPVGSSVELTGKMMVFSTSLDRDRETFNVGVSRKRQNGRPLDELVIIADGPVRFVR